jgi:hypothetical protein
MQSSLATRMDALTSTTTALNTRLGVVEDVSEDDASTLSEIISLTGCRRARIPPFLAPHPFMCGLEHLPQEWKKTSHTIPN